MKLQHEDIVVWASEGYTNLLIQPGKLPASQYISQPVSYPDDWFCELCGYDPKVGKKPSNWYLTRAGLKAFESDLRAAFEPAAAAGKGSSRNGILAWADYLDRAEMHFAEVEKAKQKLVKKHQKIMDLLNKFNV